MITTVAAANRLKRLERDLRFSVGSSVLCFCGAPHEATCLPNACWADARKIQCIHIIIWNSCNFILGGGGGYGTHTGRRSEKRRELWRGRERKRVERKREKRKRSSSSLRRCSDGRAARRRRRVGVVLCVHGAWGFFGRPGRPWRQYSPGPRAAVTADRDTQSTAPRRLERSRHEYLGGVQ